PCLGLLSSDGADRSGERNRSSHAGLIAVDARRMPPAGGVLDEPRITGPKDVLRAIAEADLELAGDDDDELPPRRRVPGEEAPDGVLPERALCGRQTFSPLRGLGQIDRLDVGFAVGARVEPECCHRNLLRVWRRTSGMIAHARSRGWRCPRRQ